MSTTVEFRVNDEARRFVGDPAQPLLWQTGYRLGFTDATVVQERNPHDYIKDFESELPCYLLAGRATEMATACVQPRQGLNDNLLAVYQALAQEKIIASQELPLLRQWTAALASVH